MNTAWETTVEDVETVLNAHAIDLNAEEIHSSLDMDDIEDAALFGDSAEQQTNYAYQEIEHQLVKMGHVSECYETKFNI